MRDINKIQKVNPELADKIIGQAGFLNSEQVKEIEKIDRMMMLLVRCGNGRFLCPAQNTEHFVGIITEHAKLKEQIMGQPFQGDHVRDVSLPV